MCCPFVTPLVSHFHCSSRSFFWHTNMLLWLWCIVNVYVIDTHFGTNCMCELWIIQWLNVVTIFDSLCRICGHLGFQHLPFNEQQDWSPWQWDTLYSCCHDIQLKGPISRPGHYCLQREWGILAWMAILEPLSHWKLANISPTLDNTERRDLMTSPWAPPVSLNKRIISLPHTKSGVACGKG